MMQICRMPKAYIYELLLKMYQNPLQMIEHRWGHFEQNYRRIPQ